MKTHSSARIYFPTFVPLTQQGYEPKPNIRGNSSKAIGKQKYTSEGIPIEWNGCDWHYYKLIMRNVFEEQKVSDLVVERYDKKKFKTAEVQESYDQLQLRAKRYIFTSLSRDLLHQVPEHKTAPELWRALVAIYEDKSDPTVRGHRVQQRFTSFGMQRWRKRGM